MKNVQFSKISRSVQETDAIYLDLDGAVKMEKKNGSRENPPHAFSSGRAECSINVFHDENSDEKGAPTSWECQGAIVTSGGD